MSSVEIEELRVAYGVTLVIDGLPLAIEDGSFFALLGQSGCGKTTLLRTFAGFIPAASGRIRFGERDITSLPAHPRDIGLIFQDAPYFRTRLCLKTSPTACAPGASQKRPSRTDIDVSKIVSPPKLSDIKVLPIDEEEAAAKRTEFLAQWASAVAEAR